MILECTSCSTVIEFLPDAHINEVVEDTEKVTFKTPPIPTPRCPQCRAFQWKLFEGDVSTLTPKEGERQ